MTKKLRSKTYLTNGCYSCHSRSLIGSAQFTSNRSLSIVSPGICLAIQCKWVHFLSSHSSAKQHHCWPTGSQRQSSNVISALVSLSMVSLWSRRQSRSLSQNTVGKIRGQKICKYPSNSQCYLILLSIDSSHSAHSVNPRPAAWWPTLGVVQPHRCRVYQVIWDRKSISFTQKVPEIEPK